MGDLFDQDLGPLQILVFAICGFIILAFAAFMIAAVWKVYSKAGKPGWAAIVPIYNLIVLLEIIGRPLWWIFLFLIPLANVVFSFIVHIDLAKSFGKTTGKISNATKVGISPCSVLPSRRREVSRTRTCR